MSDHEFGGASNDDLSLPRATVQKIIGEILTALSTPSSPELTFSKDARDLLIECCVEFVTLISSEANEIAEKEAKKTIAAEHIVKALTDLQFEEYIPDIEEAAVDFKESAKNREKKQAKWQQSGLSPEELMRQQQELFGMSREKYNQGDEGEGEGE